jgi:hypothetical protein
MLDITNRVVSIDLAIGEVGAGMLCFSHAERIVVPRGWTLVDNRTVRPPLFDGERYEVPAPPAPLPSVEVATPLAAPKRRERKRRSALPGADGAESGDATTDQPNGAADQFDLSDSLLPVRPGVIRVDTTSEDVEVVAEDIEVVVDVTVDVRAEVNTGGDTDAGELDQYDLPAGYREAALGDIEEPDRTASPLLARAFDMTRTKRR